MDLLLHDYESVLKHISEISRESFVILNGSKIAINDLVLIKDNQTTEQFPKPGLYNKNGIDIFANNGVFHGIVKLDKLDRLKGELFKKVHIYARLHHERALFPPDLNAMDTAKILIERIQNCDTEEELVRLQALVNSFEKKSLV